MATHPPLGVSCSKNPPNLDRCSNLNPAETRCLTLGLRALGEDHRKVTQSAGTEPGPHFFTEHFSALAAQATKLSVFGRICAAGVRFDALTTSLQTLPFKTDTLTESRCRLADIRELQATKPDDWQKWLKSDRLRAEADPFIPLAKQSPLPSAAAKQDPALCPPGTDPKDPTGAEPVISGLMNPIRMTQDKNDIAQKPTAAEIRHAVEQVSKKKNLPARLKNAIERLKNSPKHYANLEEYLAQFRFDPTQSLAEQKQELEEKVEEIIESDAATGVAEGKPAATDVVLKTDLKAEVAKSPGALAVQAGANSNSGKRADVSDGHESEGSGDGGSSSSSELSPEELAQRRKDIEEARKSLASAEALAPPPQILKDEAEVADALIKQTLDDAAKTIKPEDKAEFLNQRALLEQKYAELVKNSGGKKPSLGDIAKLLTSDLGGLLKNFNIPISEALSLVFKHGIPPIPEGGIQIPKGGIAGIDVKSMIAAASATSAGTGSTGGTAGAKGGTSEPKGTVARTDGGKTNGSGGNGSASGSGGNGGTGPIPNANKMLEARTFSPERKKLGSIQVPSNMGTSPFNYNMWDRTYYFVNEADRLGYLALPTPAQRETYLKDLNDRDIIQKFSKSEEFARVMKALKDPSILLENQSSRPPPIYSVLEVANRLQESEQSAETECYEKSHKGCTSARYEHPDQTGTWEQRKEIYRRNFSRIAAKNPEFAEFRKELDGFLDRVARKPEDFLKLQNSASSLDQAKMIRDFADSAEGAATLGARPDGWKPRETIKALNQAILDPQRVNYSVRKHGIAPVAGRLPSAESREQPASAAARATVAQSAQSALNARTSAGDPVSGGTPTPTDQKKQKEQKERRASPATDLQTVSAETLELKAIASNEGRSGKADLPDLANPETGETRISLPLRAQLLLDLAVTLEYQAPVAALWDPAFTQAIEASPMSPLERHAIDEIFLHQACTLAKGRVGNGPRVDLPIINSSSYKIDGKTSVPMDLAKYYLAALEREAQFAKTSGPENSLKTTLERADLTIDQHLQAIKAAMPSP